MGIEKKEEIYFLEKLREISRVSDGNLEGTNNIMYYVTYEDGDETIGVGIWDNNREQWVCAIILNEECEKIFLHNQKYVTHFCFPSDLKSLEQSFSVFLNQQKSR